MRSNLGYESSSFLDVVFNALQERKMIQRIHTVEEEGRESEGSSALKCQNENLLLDAMDDIQSALLPTLMNAAAMHGTFSCFMLSSSFYCFSS